MFQLAFSWGVQPGEFWDMTMNEWHALHEINRVSNNAGSLTDDQVDEILDDLELTDDEWWKKHGTS